MHPGSVLHNRWPCEFEVAWREKKGVCALLKKSGVFLLLLVFVVTAAGFWSGCRPEEETEAEADLLMDGRGVLIGQIDRHSVEIEVDGQPKVFALGERVNVEEISDGSTVIFTYVEEEERPVLVSIAAIEEPVKIHKDEGVFVGLDGPRVVEIEVDGDLLQFALEEGEAVDDIAEGSEVFFTYQETENMPLLLSIEAIDEPADREEDVSEDEIQAEGILVGLLDAHSVEIKLTRAFKLGEGVGVEDIEDGSQVAFTFTEEAQGAVLVSIEVVDAPPEGDVMVGTLLGKIDGRLVEIKYFQAFTLGEGVNVEGIDEGSQIDFTYRPDPHRPVLTSLEQR